MGVVVLAAGESRRLPGPKQLAEYRGETLLKRAARTAVEAGCGPVVAVIPAGAAASAMRAELAGLDVRVVENRQAAKGLSTSVRAGLEALDAAAASSTTVGVAGGAAAAPAAGVPSQARLPEAALFITCDQPLVTADVLRRVVAAYGAGRPPAVACQYGGTVGVPALFSRSVFAVLSALEGDAGAKRVLQRHAGETVKVPFSDGEVDDDTAADLARLG